MWIFIYNLGILDKLMFYRNLSLNIVGSISRDRSVL